MGYPNIVRSENNVIPAIIRGLDRRWLFNPLIVYASQIECVCKLIPARKQSTTAQDTGLLYPWQYLQLLKDKRFPIEENIAARAIQQKDKDLFAKLSG
jgi:hypothetical protein